jgi:environmental stress-induced protein Ves
VGHVASDGPFSIFPGIDRTIAILTGAGMRLSVGEAFPVTLAGVSSPYEFNGDVRTSAVLVDGPVDDLNIMSRRPRFTHRVERRRLNDAFMLPLDADVVAVLPRGGDVEILLGATLTGLADGNTALVERPTVRTTVEEAQVRPLGSGIDLYVIELYRRER